MGVIFATNTITELPRGIVSGHVIPWRPLDGVHYHDFPMSLDDFIVEEDRELTCPCDASLSWDGTAGAMIRAIRDHCRAVPGHPLAFGMLREMS